MGLSWDAELPQLVIQKFERWKRELPNLNDLEIPRYLRDLTEQTKLSIHVFCDASKTAFATCIFLRTQSACATSCQLIQARNRVAPLKQISIPRLELLSCTIGARLAKTTVSELRLENVPIVYWSDSANALYWIKGNENWATFVYNRVQEIRKLTNPEEWRHISGKLNPADLPSRGCNAKELVRSRWWEGPSWLKKPEEDWPTTETLPDLDIINSEKRKSVVSATNTATEHLEYLSKISSYRKIMRITAWIFRFHRNAKTQKNERNVSNLNADEITMAEKIILKQIQNECFNANQKLNLQTFLDSNGLLRVKSKISQRNDLTAFRFPILLPYKNDVVKKLIYERHIDLGHAGIHILMSSLREDYWIIGGRKTIRQVIRACVRCQRYSSRPLEVVSAPLPEDRVRDALIFEVIGIDLCGPLYLKSKVKCWVVLFTCAVFRAVHIELVSCLSTDNFLLALRRFISRRGRPTTIYSDNGTNLVGASNELKSVDWGKILEYASVKRIHWKFNPPSAPWWGGFWERLIGMLKSLIRKILGKASLQYEELYTVLCDAESIINSRPLTYITEDNEDLVALTPAMFLQEIKETGVPDLDQIDAKTMNKRFLYRQKLCQDLRKRFRTEYLGHLREFSKVRREFSIEVGDIVLIGDSNLKRINWPLGRIAKLYPGKDKRVRVVEVITKSGSFLRPIQKLYPLELNKIEPSAIPCPDVNQPKLSRYGRVLKSTISSLNT